MGLTLSLYFVAGLGSLGLGAGVLLRDRKRPRNVHFALLAFALSLWNLGIVTRELLPPESRDWARALFLAGSCTVGPAALQFALGLAGTPPKIRRRVVGISAAFALGLWLLGSFVLTGDGVAWSWAALLVLGPMTIAAAATIGLRTLRLAPGPQRRAHGLIFLGGIVAVLGGLSDFIPREPGAILQVGPIAVLPLLLIVCAVVVRHRFLDIHVFLIRAVSLIAGAATVALVYFGVLRLIDPAGRYTTLFLSTCVLILLIVPVGRQLLGRARDLLVPSDPVSRAFAEVSRGLAEANAASEVREAFDGGRRALPGDTRFALVLRGNGQRRFRRVLYSGNGEPVGPAAIDPDDPLPTWLDGRRLPVTRGQIEAESIEQTDPTVPLSQLDALGYRLVIPLLRNERLIGWFGVGLADRLLTAEAANALAAVANQATTSLERLEVLERARRQQALAAVGELAAGLAHEIRNPVAAIHGAAKALGPEATETQRAEMLEVIGQESERLGRFVGEFLDYARPAPPRRTRIDLRTAVERAFRSATLAGMKIEPELRAVSSLPEIEADPDQIARVLDNLLRNAWEAGGAGVRVVVDLEADGPDGVTMRIEDNGPGIPEEQVATVFQPFESNRSGGTGLGLALVHRIVDSHGGEIRVEGRPGQGAAFEITLPIGRTEER